MAAEQQLLSFSLRDHCYAEPERLNAPPLPANNQRRSGGEDGPGEAKGARAKEKPFQEAEEHDVTTEAGNEALCCDWCQLRCSAPSR